MAKFWIMAKCGVTVAVVVFALLLISALILDRSKLVGMARSDGYMEPEITGGLASKKRH